MAFAVFAREERVQQTPFGTYMAVWNKPDQPRQQKCFASPTRHPVFDMTL